jgi:hypothetical protein
MIKQFLKCSNKQRMGVGAKIRGWVNMTVVVVDQGIGRLPLTAEAQVRSQVS